MTPAVDQYCVT